MDRGVPCDGESGEGMTVAPVALLLLALLLYGLTVGCADGVHRDTEVREHERNGAWHVVLVCACNRWSYREVYRS